jgi:hypothetical protein
MPTSDLLLPFEDYLDNSDSMNEFAGLNELLQPSDDDKHARRKDECGKIVACGINVLTGRPNFRTNYCGCYNCDICMGKRATEKKTRVEKAQFEGSDIFQLRTSDEKEIARIRSLTKENYMSFPQAEKGEFVFFYSAELPLTSSSTQVYNIDDFSQEEWMEMTRKRPYKSRCSGALGATKSEETGKTEKVKVMEISTSSENFNDVRAALEEARKETVVNPTTASEAEDAVKEIILLAGEKLQAKGIEYHTTYKTWRIETSRICWNTIRDNFNHNLVNTPQPDLNQLEFASFSA